MIWPVEIFWLGHLRVNLFVKYQILALLENQVTQVEFTKEKERFIKIIKFHSFIKAL